MIICLYCGNQCPDGATICSNCGKPLPSRTIASAKSLTKEEISALLQREKLAAAPKQAFQYSGLLYISLAMIVAAVILFELFG